MLRDGAGYATDAAGKRLQRGGRDLAASANNDPRMINTGAWEPNPKAAERYGESYNARDIRRLCYPPARADDTRWAARYTARALKQLESIERAGGCVIERVEGGRGVPITKWRWRIYPPDPPEAQAWLAKNALLYRVCQFPYRVSQFAYRVSQFAYRVSHDAP